MKTIQINVTGRVQGVCFRAATLKQAEKLAVMGFVKNNTDGSVEIVAQAEQVILDKLVAWCYKGSIMAKVTDVTVIDIIISDQLASFEIL